MSDLTYEKLMEAKKFFDKSMEADLRESAIRKMLPADFEQRCKKAYMEFLLTGKVGEI